MRQIKLTLLLVGFATSLFAAEMYEYKFVICNPEGEILAEGTVASPLKFKQDGKATGTWTFRESRSQPKHVDGNWLKVKNLLVTGSGKVNISCDKGKYTLDFQPGMSDNNVVVMWDTAKEPAGQLYYDDIAGGHRAGLFKFKEQDQQSAPANEASPRC